LRRRPTIGEPLYPQRPLLAGQDVQSGGATMSGRFHGKMIVVQALMDEAAYPWGADWYRSRVRAALGPAFEDRYRLWFVENAMHVTQGVGPNDPRPVASTRVVSYQGVLQQALRDVAAWVEAPPGAGVIATAEWDFEGDGRFPVKSEPGAPSSSASLRQTFVFERAGTYFPAVRIASRRPDDKSLYAQPKNIGRVRVVVA
jgi:hypothetical protein